MSERCPRCNYFVNQRNHPLDTCCPTCGSTFPEMDRDPTGTAFNWSAHRRDVARYTCPDAFHVPSTNEGSEG
jgi:hypothetical protein